MPVVARGGKLVGAFTLCAIRLDVLQRGAPSGPIAGVAAQAAIAMDNARLFASARELIDKLEKTNAELDQFAYVGKATIRRLPCAASRT